MKGTPKLFKIAWSHLRHTYMKLFISAQRTALGTFIRKVRAQQTTPEEPIVYMQEIPFLCLCVYTELLLWNGGSILLLGDIFPPLSNSTLLTQNQIFVMQLLPVYYGLSHWGQRAAGHCFACSKSSSDLSCVSPYLLCALPTQLHPCLRRVFSFFILYVFNSRVSYYNLRTTSVNLTSTSHRMWRLNMALKYFLNSSTSILY